MREILFRGKRTDNGEWIEGYLAAYDLICPSYPEDTLNATGEYCGQVPYVGFVEVDPKSVGEYTGMSDKNGKRIFEGDIVFLANRFGKGLHWIVVWHKGTLSLKQGLCDYWACFEDMEGYTFEVVGNIRDEPDDEEE